jgi:hypothetical protein
LQVAPKSPDKTPVPATTGTALNRLAKAKIAFVTARMHDDTPYANRVGSMRDS